MEAHAEYIVEKIDGDYAYLKRIDKDMDDLNQVARALLPPEITEGSTLIKEWFEYRIK
ncbi:MAG TPA: chorismate--pyruvate lyase [Lachnospiraceae bacterium]|nr:chorismate--pyruvate lyase [Lachnospiraceae bacterium]